MEVSGISSSSQMDEGIYHISHNKTYIITTSQKMMVHSNRIEEVRMALGFYKAFMVDNQGRSGGLAMLWRSSVRGEMVNFSKNFISLNIEVDNVGSWILIGFYGILDRAKRRNSWNLFRTLAANICFPWCVIGDFNDLLSNEDKCGRVDHPLLVNARVSRSCWRLWAERHCLRGLTFYLG